MPAPSESKAAYIEAKVMVKFGLPCWVMRFPRKALADFGFGAQNRIQNVQSQTKDTETLYPSVVLLIPFFQCLQSPPLDIP